MTDPEPVQLRKLIATGKTNDGGHSLVATMYVPADHVSKAEAYLLGAGYDVANPEPDSHATPPTGEVYGDPDEHLHPHYHAHAAYLAATGVEDLDAHVAALRAARAAN